MRAQKVTALVAGFTLLVCDPAGQRDVSIAAAQGREPALQLLVIPDALQNWDFATTATLVWLADSALAVIDSYDKQVVIFHLGNGESRRVGRGGGGPGEFENPVILLASEDGGFVVADIKLLRVSQFDGDLQFVRSRPIPAAPLHLLKLQGDRVWMIWAPFFGSTGPVIGSIDLATGATEEHVSLFEADPELAEPPREPGMRSSVFVSAASANGLTLVGHGHRYRVAALDWTGAIRRSFGRPELRQTLPSEDDIARYRESLYALQRPGAALPLDQLEDFVRDYGERPLPFFYRTSFAADRDGRLWVASSRRSRDGAEVDLFDGAGNYARTLQMRDRVMVLAPRLPYIAALVERVGGPYDGFHGIDVYRVAQ